MQGSHYRIGLALAWSGANYAIREIHIDSRPCSLNQEWLIYFYDCKPAEFSQSFKNNKILRLKDRLSLKLHSEAYI